MASGIPIFACLLLQYAVQISVSILRRAVRRLPAAARLFMRTCQIRKDPLTMTTQPQRNRPRLAGRPASMAMHHGLGATAISRRQDGVTPAIFEQACKADARPI